MNDTVLALMDTLCDSLEYIDNFKMREHIKNQVRMAQGRLDDEKINRLREERDEIYARLIGE